MMRKVDVSPYRQTLVTDYYDGERAGYTRSVEDGKSFHFEMVWWDEQQNWRLFRFNVMDGKAFWKIAATQPGVIDEAEPFYLIVQNLLTEVNNVEMELSHYVLCKKLDAELCMFYSDE